LPKRSVEIIESFCGWDFLLKLIDKCGSNRNKALISTLFETGGRVSEVLDLQKDNFIVQSKYVIVKSMPVHKSYRKVGEKYNKDGKKVWITQPKKRFRTFPIPKSEPLCHYMLNYINQIKESKLFGISRIQTYRIVRSLDSQIFPHWFRAQRASQLALEYGFSVHDLIDFFNWKSLSTAIHYSRMGWKGLATKMKV
jgi:site-specific recombinase XerD